MVNSQQHSIPQQYKLNSNAIAEESEFTNFDLELKRNQKSDVQQHKKNISDLPMSYSNFDTYNNDSFREKNLAQNYLDHSEKKPRIKENSKLPKSKTKIQLNKDKKISSDYSYGISNQRILSNKKKSKDRLNNEDQPYFPFNNNDNNFSNNLIYKSQFVNNNLSNSNNNNNNVSNPFKSRPNHPISNAFEDRERKERSTQLNKIANNTKKNGTNINSNNNNNIGVNNINFSNNIIHPNSMRVSNASSKSGISFSNNINNLNNNFINNNQPTKNEMIKNNYLIDLLKENGNESNKNINNKLLKMNTLNNNKNNFNNQFALEKDFIEDEEGKFLNENNNDKNFYEDEAEVDFIDNDSFDNKDNAKKDYFYIAVEQSQKLLNSNSNNNNNNLSPNFNIANEHKGFTNPKSLLVNNDLLTKSNMYNNGEIPKSELLLPKKNLKLNTKLTEENFKKGKNDIPDGSKSDYQPNGRNQFFFDGKPASVKINSNRHKESNKDLLLFNLNNNNSNNTSHNKIDMKNNTFAKDSSMHKEKEENEGQSNVINPKEFLKTLEIMKNYLKIEQKQFLEKQNEMIKKNQEKDIEIARLKV